MTRRLIGCLVVLLLLACAPLVFAQKDNTRSVQGSVTKPDETPAVGAVVQLKNMKTLQIRSFYHPGRRHVCFFELSPDVDYELQGRLPWHYEQH